MRESDLKIEAHTKIAQQTAEFLAQGGEIVEVPSNVYNQKTEYQQKNKSAFGEADKCTSSK